MLFFAGTISKDSKKVISFTASPQVDNAITVYDDAVWGKQASATELNNLAMRMLKQVAIDEVANRWSHAYAEEVLKKIDSDKRWYILGDHVRAWLDLQLLYASNNIVTEGLLN